MVTLVGNVVIVIVAIAIVGYTVRSNLHRLRWEKPLRDEMLASPATFRTEVEVQDLRGPISLSVHGDAFQVTQRVPLIRFVNGTDYCYRARDTTLETAHGRLHDWIEIRGLPGTGAEPIRIGRRKNNRLIWDALVRAGADPIGPPPER